MQRSRVFVLVLAACAALGSTVALAQHHHHRHHGQSTNDQAADAGPPPPPARDAGTAARPSGGGGRAPTSNGQSTDAARCIAHTRISGENAGLNSGASGCDSNDDCVVAHATCCMPCGVQRPEDVVAITTGAVDNWNAGLCSSENECQRCSSQPNPNLSAACQDGQCVVVIRDPCP